MIPQPIDQVPLFLRLSEDERESISSRLRHLEFNADDTVFSAGKPAEMLAIIAQGWIKLESDTPQGRISLANLGAGSVLGEVDLLLGRPHSTHARAASATHLLVLNRQDLQDLILEHPTIGLSFSASLGTRVVYLDEYLVTHRLLAAPLLSSLAEDELRALAGKLQFRSYPRGETLFEAGGDGQAAFLVEQGTLRLITPSREGESYEEFQAGDLIGQTSLITGKPYGSTARAVTDLSAWVLTRSDYEQLIREHPTIQVAFSRALAEMLSKDEQAQAVEQLRAMPLFADVDGQALADIASCLVLRHFPAGEMIYAEGTPGDAMYLVESGTVRLSADSTPDGRVLDRKTVGQAFGEMSLLTGRTRAEAAQALEDTIVWALYKSDYDDLIVRHPSASLALSRALSGRLGSVGSEQLEQQLTGFGLFGGLSKVELRHVVEFVKPLRFHSGETVCFAGQNAQYVYLIARGEIREIAGGSNGQAVVLALHGENQSFGEHAVMQATPYPTTMQAVGDVECLTLSKPDFDRLVSLHPALALNLARLMAREAEMAGQRQPVRRAPPPPRMSVPPPPPRAVTYAGAPRGNGTRPISPPRPPTMSQPVPVAPSAPMTGVRTAPARPWDRQSGVVRPMPAANSRPIALNGAGVGAGAAYGAAMPRRSAGTGGFMSQLSAMSTGGKVKLGVLAIAGLFLLVVVPLLVIVSLITTSGAFAGFSGNPPASRDLPANFEGEGIQQAALAQMTGKLAVRERTATPTLLPPTAIPTAKPTVKPTVKRQAPAAPKAPAKTAEPTAAPPPAVAAAAAPAALPPRVWDKRLGPGGLPLLTQIGVKDAAVQPGQSFYRLTKMVFQDAGAESGNDHTIYITILDENGVRDEKQTVLITWEQGGAIEEQRLDQADQKPAGDYCNCNYNWPMYGAAYRARIDGTVASEEVYGMIMPEKRHVNYLLTFQKVVRP